MGFQPGEEHIGVIDHITTQGSAVVEADGKQIHLGRVPHIRGKVRVQITSVEPYCRGRLCLDDATTLRLIPTSYSTTVEAHELGPDITYLRLGSDSRLRVEGRLQTGKAVEIDLTDTSTEPFQGAVRSDESGTSRTTFRGQGRESVEVNGASIGDLVGNINRSSTAEAGKSKRQSAGGSAREKYSCKCCGARIDTGTHLCGVCQQAGCSTWKRLCRFA